MKIKLAIGKNNLSSKISNTPNKYQKQNQKMKQQQTTINNLKKQKKHYIEIINDKDNQIKEFENHNNEMMIKITENNKTHDENLKMINTLHELEVNQKNEKIKQLKDKNNVLTRKINHIQDTLRTYEQMLINTEMNLNYHTIKFDDNFNENERKIVSKSDNLNKNSSTYLITIIIPVYNLEKYIEKCFLSLLRQTIGFHNLEIIFVDDCSTDNSYEILREYAMNYANVKLFQTDKNSKAAGKPRNIGMKYASSDYIIFLDGDDEFYEYACKTLYDKIVETSSSLVSGMYTQFNTVNNQEEIPLSLLLNTFTDNNIKFDERRKNLEHMKKKYPKEIVINDINQLPYIVNNYKLASKIFNLKFLRDNKITFPEFIAAQDSVFLYKCIVSSKKLIFIKDVIYKYTSNRSMNDDKSVTYSDDTDLHISRLKAYNMIYDFSLEKGLEDITVKYLIKEKMSYFFKKFVFDKNLSDDDLIKIFDNCKNLCNLLIHEDILLSDRLRELFSRIVNCEYNEAILLC